MGCTFEGRAGGRVWTDSSGDAVSGPHLSVLGRASFLLCIPPYSTPEPGGLEGPPWPGFLLALVVCAGPTPGPRSLELCLQPRAKPPESRKSETNPFAFFIFIFIFGGSFALGSTVDAFSLSFALSVRRRRCLSPGRWLPLAVVHAPRQLESLQTMQLRARKQMPSKGTSLGAPSGSVAPLVYRWGN